MVQLKKWRPLWAPVKTQVPQTEDMKALGLIPHSSRLPWVCLTIIFKLKFYRDIPRQIFPEPHHMFMLYRIGRNLPHVRCNPLFAKYVAAVWLQFLHTVWPSPCYCNALSFNQRCPKTWRKWKVLVLWMQISILNAIYCVIYLPNGRVWNLMHYINSGSVTRKHFYFCFLTF